MPGKRGGWEGEFWNAFGGFGWSNAGSDPNQAPPPELKLAVFKGRVCTVTLGDGLYHRITVPRDGTPERAAKMVRVQVIRKRDEDPSPTVLETYWSMGTP